MWYGIFSVSVRCACTATRSHEENGNKASETLKSLFRKKKVFLMTRMLSKWYSFWTLSVQNLLLDKCQWQTCWKMLWLIDASSGIIIICLMFSLAVQQFQQHLHAVKNTTWFYSVQLKWDDTRLLPIVTGFYAIWSWGSIFTDNIGYVR